jgi:hypothetical protein
MIGGPQVFRPKTGGAPVVVSMREGAHILVTVVDVAGAPIVNADVRVVGEDAITVTDEKGDATVTAHPGWVAVEAVAAKRAPRRISIPLGSAGSIARIKIVLHEGFTVSGRALDEERKPIANVRIVPIQTSAMLTDSDEDREAVVTDEHGTFTIPAAVGLHALVATDDVHAPAVTPRFDVDHAIDGLEIVMKRGRSTPAALSMQMQSRSLARESTATPWARSGRVGSRRRPMRRAGSRSEVCRARP